MNEIIKKVMFAFILARSPTQFNVTCVDFRFHTATVSRDMCALIVKSFRCDLYLQRFTHSERATSRMLDTTGLETLQV